MGTEAEPLSAMAVLNRKAGGRSPRHEKKKKEGARKKRRGRKREGQKQGGKRLSYLIIGLKLPYTGRSDIWAC